MKRPALIITALAVAVVGFGGAWWGYGPCGRLAVDGSIRDLAAQIERFQQTTTVASNTPRLTLAIPIAQLSEIRLATLALAVPACLSPARAQAASGMESSVRVFTAFAAEQTHNLDRDSKAAADAFAAATSEIERIRLCAPFCRSLPAPVP